MNQKRNNDELLTTVFGSKEVLEPAPADVIPQGMMRPEIAYQIVKDETYPQTQPRLNLATFVTTYMDEYATRLMNEAISVNYIDETEYPRIAVMNGRCINMIANLWNTPEKAQWKAGALGIGSSEACMLGGDERRFPGGVGEVLPALANRTANRASDAEEPDARSRAGARHVRREHDLYRTDSGRYLDGSER